MTCGFRSSGVGLLALLTALATLAPLLFVLALPERAEAAPGINPQIYYQGILEDLSGSAVANGSYDMTFRLYSAASGGTALWTGTHTAGNGNAVTTTDGVFTVLLGSGTGNSLATFDFNQDTLYLGITVGTDSEMSPRQRVAAAAYAFNADKLDGFDAIDFLQSNGVLRLGVTTDGEIDTATGSLTLDSASGTVIVDDALSIVGTTTLSGVLDAGSNRITNVATPTVGSDAATKSYVDSFAQGLVWQAPAVTIGSTTPPTTPTTGDRHIVAASGAAGAWAGEEHNIAEWTGSAWSFASSTVGFSAFVQSENRQYSFNGSAWVELGAGTDHASLAGLQGGTAGQYYHVTQAVYEALTDPNAQLAALHTDAAPTFAGATLTGTTTVSGGALRAQGAINQQSLGIDRIDFGVQDGSPRMVFEDAGFTNWLIDNAGGTFRWYTPGIERLTLDTSGTLDLKTGGLEVNGTSVLTDGRALENLTGITTTGFTATNSTTTNLALSGVLYDRTNSAGTSGMVLQTTGAGAEWVATSTLGISGGTSLWSENGSNVYYNSGSVGIGTNSPASALTVQGDFHALGSGGAPGLFFDESTGRVGVGTDNPTSLFTISSGTSGDAELTLMADTDNNNENDNPAIHLTQDGGAGRSFIALEGLAGTRSTDTLANALIIGGETSQTAVQLITNNAARLTVDLSGNVGIGTTASAARLTLHATGTQDILNLREAGGSEVFTVLESGNVGLGTTTPTHTLSVAGDAAITGTTTLGHLSLAGLLVDGAGSAGAVGNVLQRTTTGLEWVATSSLGISGGSSGSSSSSGSETSPSFAVYTTTDQSFNVTSKINWEAERFDTNDDFDLANDRFQPSVPGTYLLTASAYCSGSSANWCAVFLYKNGVAIADSWDQGTQEQGNITQVVEANGTTDYFEIYVSSGNRTVFSGSGRYTRFSGSRIGGGGSGTSNQIAILVDEKANNTDAGVFTAGAWQTRDLNTEYQDDIGVTIAANEFTLPAGTYEIYAVAPAYRINRHQARLYNVSAATTTLVGSSEYTANSGGLSQTQSTITGTFTIASSQTFRIEHRAQSSFSPNGLGVASNFGEPEVYTQVTLRKLNGAGSIAAFTGASASAAGTAGLVPQPSAGAHGSLLLGSGTWLASTTLFIDTGTSRIGIGTTTPQAPLHIAGGSALFDRGANTSGFGSTLTLGGARNLSGNNVGSLNFQNYDSDGSAADYLAAQIASRNHTGTDSGNLRFSVSDGSALSLALMIDSAGDVGIGGEQTPDFKLEVVGTSTKGYFGLSSAENNDGDILTVNSAGNVGIGTTTPTHTLSVAGDAAITGTTTLGHLSLAGLLVDGAGSAGAVGNVLQRTTTGLQWVATSTLGISGGNTSPFTSAAGSGTAYDISTATFDSVVLDVSAQETVPTAMLFNNTGTTLYVIGSNGDDINAYTLGTAYDISTATFDSVVLSVAAQETAPFSMLFNNTGTTLYVMGLAGDDINAYPLPTPYDISSYTSGTSVALSVAAQEGGPAAMLFNDTGTTLYVMGVIGDDINAYTLGTPWDISTATFSSVVLDVSGQDGNPHDMVFNSDGTVLYVLGVSGRDINAYTLGTAYDISTATFDSVVLSVVAQDTSPNAMLFNDTGTTLYVIGNAGDDINAYTIPFTQSSIYATDATKHVGIGTDNPQNRLHVVGALTLASTTPAATANALYNQGGTLYWNGSALDAGGSSLWSENGSNVYYNSGNVGIGTNSPTHQFQVYGTSAGIRLTRTTSEPFIWLDTNQSGASSGGQLRGISGGGIRFTNGTGGTGTHEWMRFTSTGNVGIGIASPARKLHVSTSANEPPVRFQDSSGYCEINPVSTAWTCTSDATLKTNVLTLESTLADVLALNPVNFDWESEDTATSSDSARERGERYGLIAQEVEELFPHLVTTDTETGLKSVAYGGLTIPLLKATQEIALIASSTAATTTEATGEQTFVGRFFDRLVAWLADAGNGIGKLFAREVHTSTLCLTKTNGDTVCLTAEDIEHLNAAVNTNADVPGNPADTRASVTIHITGNNPAEIEVGDTYGDIGALASSTDPDLVALGVRTFFDGTETTSPQIDTSVAGTHEITYRVLDGQGSVLAEAVRTVVVIDPSSQQNATTTASTATSTSPTTATTTATTTTSNTPPPDTTPPTITLNGNSEVTLIIGDQYTDEGATATDETDGDLTGSIVVGGGTVDTTTPGTYTVTYEATDAAGNTATATRTVIVEAPPPPQDPPQSDPQPDPQDDPNAQPPVDPPPPETPPASGDASA